MATTQKRPASSRPQSPQRRKKKKNNDSFLYIAISLMIVFIILIGAIIVICNNNDAPAEESSSSSEVSSQPELSKPVESSIPEESQIIETGWKEENGKKYYLDENGNKFTGVNTIDGAIYVFAADGNMEKGGLATVGKDIYYLGEDGKAFTGWKEIDGYNHYFGSDGKAAIGETEIEGKRHFFSSKGKEFIVANPWNEVSDQVDDLVTLPSSYGDQSRAKISNVCKADLMEMMDDCYRITGCNVYVISGHRTYSYQERNYNNEVSIYRNQGYGEEEARKLAAEWVAVPGTSEHHLGLAVDIIDTQSWSLDESQENLAGQKWMMENCWKYGFILRYPKNTKDETGINYEPWHYRYLGREIAKEVHDSGMTLEGYIKSLG